MFTIVLFNHSNVRSVELTEKQKQSIVNQCKLATEHIQVVSALVAIAALPGLVGASLLGISPFFNKQTVPVINTDLTFNVMAFSILTTIPFLAALRFLSENKKCVQETIKSFGFENDPELKEYL